MRVRTISQLYGEVKRIDPDSALTPTAIRRLVITGKIPSARAGKKYLVTVEALEAYMNGSTQTTDNVPAPQYGQIRPVG